MAFVLSLFVPHLSFFWCLGKAVMVIGIFRESSHIYVVGTHLHWVGRWLSWMHMYR